MLTGESETEIKKYRHALSPIIWIYYQKSTTQGLNKKIAIGGDYNVTMGADLDCSGGNPAKKDSLKYIQDISLNFDLVDIWRV